MKITAHDNNPPYEKVSEISIPFPTSKYKKLLTICKLTDKDELGPHQLTQIFVHAIHHFLLGHLSQDDLSAIANKLWGGIKGGSEEKFGKVGAPLYAAAELAFYGRRIYYPDNISNEKSYISFMKEVMKFYDENKSIIN